jgi:eukaryotic translation initiation factor 2C
VLIYDEIGLKLSEIELFTYWTTHLYCRCTRSVSYATPAYYAHWAARRGKALLSAGASVKELSELSQGWLQEGLPSMYFV